MRISVFNSNTFFNNLLLSRLSFKFNKISLFLIFLLFLGVNNLPKLVFNNNM